MQLNNSDSVFINYNYSLKIIRVIGVIVLDETKKGLGKRIKQLRKAKGWSQQELADKSNMQYSYLGLIERGERNPTLEIIDKIAKGLGVEISQLFLFKEGLKPEAEVLEEKVLDLFKLSDLKVKRRLLPIINAVLSLHDH